MAEKKGVGHAYNVDFLNVVFAASSLFLFLSVIWMVWDDYDREWKTTQRRFSNLELQVTQAQLQQASRSVDRAKLQQMQAQRQAAEKNVAANRAKVDELQAKLKDADNKLLRATLDMQYMKATYDQDRYDFEASRAAGTGNVARKQQIAEEEAKKLDDLELARQKAEAGSLSDVSSGDRQEGLREVPGAVHDASESGNVSRKQLAAPDRSRRLHRVP